MTELHNRVEDWKGHRLESFGDLLLHGTFQVIKGDSSSPKDQEREVRNSKPVNVSESMVNFQLLTLLISIRSSFSK